MQVKGVVDFKSLDVSLAARL